jgi:hypothetical protein
MSSQTQRTQIRNARSRFMQSIRQTLDDGKADANSCERAGPVGSGKALDLAKVYVRLCQRLFNRLNNELTRTVGRMQLHLRDCLTGAPHGHARKLRCRIDCKDDWRIVH